MVEFGDDKYHYSLGTPEDFKRRFLKSESVIQVIKFINPRTGEVNTGYMNTWELNENSIVLSGTGMLVRVPIIEYLVIARRAWSDCYTIEEVNHYPYKVVSSKESENLLIAASATPSPPIPPKIKTFLPPPMGKSKNGTLIVGRFYNAVNQKVSLRYDCVKLIEVKDEFVVVESLQDSILSWHRDSLELDEINPFVCDLTPNFLVKLRKDMSLLEETNEYLHKALKEYEKILLGISK